MLFAASWFFFPAGANLPTNASSKQMLLAEPKASCSNDQYTMYTTINKFELR